MYIYVYFKSLLFFGTLCVFSGRCYFRPSPFFWGHVFVVGKACFLSKTSLSLYRSLPVFPSLMTTSFSNSSVLCNDHLFFFLKVSQSNRQNEPPKLNCRSSVFFGNNRERGRKVWGVGLERELLSNPHLFPHLSVVENACIHILLVCVCMSSVTFFGGNCSIYLYNVKDKKIFYKRQKF